MTSTSAPPEDSPAKLSDGPSQQLDALNDALIDLREQLAEVDFRASVMRLLVGSDDQRHLDVVAEELTQSLSKFRSTGDAVVSIAAAAAEAWGVRPPERTLNVLVERAPEQWRKDLSNHARLLAKETRRLRERMSRDTGLINSGQRQVAALLELLLGDEETPVTYEPGGSDHARLVDHLA